MDIQSITQSKVKEKKPIDTIPDISMLPKSGRTGYSLTQSIAELVDNSVDARIPGHLLEIRVVLQNDFIVVEDDGSGMDFETTRDALVLGCSKKRDQLGEFGIGLKSACTSLGSSFTVITSKQNSKEFYVYKYNEEDWLSKRDKKDWTAFINVVPKKKKDINSHGTIIKIEDLRRRVSKARAGDVLRDFSNRFAPFILSKEIKILVNQEECVPQEPELTKRGKTEFNIKLPDGNKVCGWYGLLKHGSNKGFYGFNTFRRGRMITSYDKIGIPTHPTVSRIIGEVHMDHVPVSHDKKSFEPESEEYREMVTFLKREFKDLVSKARKSSLDEKINRDVISKTQVWKSAIIKAIKDIKEFEALSKKEKKRSGEPSDPVGSVLIEKRDERLKTVHQKLKSERQQERHPKKVKTIIDYFIKIKGKNYIIRHEYANLGKDSGWKDWHYSKGEPIEIYTNKDFPAYAVTRDVPFYAAIHIAEALSEIYAKIDNEGLDKAEEYKEKILRKTAEIVDEFK